MTSFAETEALNGTKILVVDDEAIVALDLAFIIESEGGCVAGPLYRLDDAMRYVDIACIDAALLDVDLPGGDVFPFADRLRASNVPIVFHTGRTDLKNLHDRYPEAHIVAKPAVPRQVVGALCHAVAPVRATADQQAF